MQNGHKSLSELTCKQLKSTSHWCSAVVWGLPTQIAVRYVQKIQGAFLHLHSKHNYMPGWLEAFYKSLNKILALFGNVCKNMIQIARHLNHINKCPLEQQAHCSKLGHWTSQMLIINSVARDSNHDWCSYSTILTCCMITNEWALPYLE